MTSIVSIRGGIVAAALALLPQVASAQTADELMAIIQEQQRQIEELSRKVDALQLQTENAAVSAEAAASAAEIARSTAEIAAVSSASAAATAELAAEGVRQAEEASPDLAVTWGPGPTFTSADGDWSVHVRGRLFVDAGILDDEDGLYHGDNATELRDARLGIEGRFLDGFSYVFEADYSDDDLTIKDAYLQYDGAPLAPGYLRLGQYKQPNSLDFLTSSQFLTFMEPAGFVNAFALGYGIGAGAGASGKSWGFDAGVFGQDASAEANDEGFALAGRGHYALFPGTSDTGDVLHVGISARYRELDNDVDAGAATYEQRPFFHFTSTRSVDTGAIANAEGDIMAGAELAWVSGPFSLQAEAANTWMQLDAGPAPDNLWGGYAGVSYFLTGEHRNYIVADGEFGRTEVLHPLNEGGAGAWELAARLDYLDLNSGVARGGEQYSAIAGVNWYLNDYTRLMLDGAVTHVFDAAGTRAAVTGSENTIYGIGARAQVDW